MGCHPSQHESKAVSLHVMLALEGWERTIGSLWHPGRSFLPGSRWWVRGGEQVLVARASRKSTPSSRLLSHHFLPAGKFPVFLLSLKPLLIPLRHRFGLCQSYLWMGLPDSALNAKSQRALENLKRGTFRALGYMELKFPPLLHVLRSWN